MDKNLKGRKVAFCNGGWSQFIVKDVDHILFFNDEVDLKLAAGSSVNPMTALSLRQMLIDRGLNSCIFFGANSNLGRMFLKLCSMENIECLAIVRDQSEIDMLKKDCKLNNVLAME